MNIKNKIKSFKNNLIMINRKIIKYPNNNNNKLAKNKIMISKIMS